MKCTTDRIIKQPSSSTAYWGDEKSSLKKKSCTILPLSSRENTRSSKNRIIFTFLHSWLPSLEMKMDRAEEILTEDFYIDSGLCLFVCAGSNTLVGPSIFIPSFVECEGGGWVIITGYRYVWSVRLYSVPTRSKPVYILGRAIDYCRARREKKKTQKRHILQQWSQPLPSDNPPRALKVLVSFGGIFFFFSIFFYCSFQILLNEM